MAYIYIRFVAIATSGIVCVTTPDEIEFLSSIGAAFLIQNVFLLITSTSHLISPIFAPSVAEAALRLSATLKVTLATARSTSNFTGAASALASVS